jgi:hypothetical protein
VTLVICYYSPLNSQLSSSFMLLKQGQTWKCGDAFVRIVDLQRLEVGYKTFKSLKSNIGTHQRTSKKDFCRMLKGATLLSGKAVSG